MQTCECMSLSLYQQPDTPILMFVFTNLQIVQVTLIIIYIIHKLIAAATLLFTLAKRIVAL